MKRRLCLTLIIIMIAGFATTTFSNDADKPLIIVIDVRTTLEWNMGHLDGAILIPYKQIGEKIGAVAPDKSQRIYVYCRTGHRAQIAKETLEKLGYKDIVNLGSRDDAANALKLKIVY